MADELREGPNVLRVPFLFVKHGDPPPLDWMARHPGWVKFPAVMIPRGSPEHPANGGKYPTFPRRPPPPAATAAVPVSDTEKWPFGRPVSDTLRGRSSRITPGNPPQYPGGLGAPPGTYAGQGEDPVAGYLRINAALEAMGLAAWGRSQAAEGALPEADDPGSSDADSGAVGAYAGQTSGNSPNDPTQQSDVPRPSTDPVAGGSWTGHALGLPANSGSDGPETSNISLPIETTSAPLRPNGNIIPAVYLSPQVGEIVEPIEPVDYYTSEVNGATAKALGITHIQLGKAIHSIKDYFGLSGNENIKIHIPSGDVLFNGEVIGNVYDEK